MSQKFYNILAGGNWWHVYLLTEAVQAEVGCSCGWKYCDSWCADMLCIFYVMCNLKAAQMNVYHVLIRELMLYERHKLKKNICFAKGETSTVTRWLKNFCLGCKNLDDQARTGRLKIVDSEVVLQAIETNPTGSIQRVSGELSISQSRVVHFHDLGKSTE